MSDLPKRPRFAFSEASLGPTVQTIDEQNGEYSSESDTSIRHGNSKSTPARFPESYENDYDRASRSRGNRASRRRDPGRYHNHRLHAPSSSACPPTSSTNQFSTYEGQSISYMEPRGGQLRPYSRPTAPYNPVHASHVAANGGPLYQGYHTSDLQFVNHGYPVNPYPAMSHHTNVHGAHPYPAGAYYADGYQYNQLHTTNMHPPDNSRYMQSHGSSLNPSLNPGYGSPISGMDEAEQIRRDLKSFKMNHTTDRGQNAREMEKEMEKEKEKERGKKKEEERSIKKEEKARAKQRKKDKEEADKMKEYLAHLTQELAELRALMYQERQKKEAKDREVLLDNKRIAFENRLRDIDHMLSTQNNPQLNQQDSRRPQGAEQMLQQIVGYMERLWGEHNNPRSELEKLKPREILARRPSIETDRSDAVRQWVDTDIKRQVEAITVNFLHKLSLEDSYGGVSNPLLELRRGSSASDFNRSSHFDISEETPDISKVGSSSSRTAVNINPTNGRPLSSKFNESHRPPDKARKRHYHASQLRAPNPPQKVFSKPPKNQGRKASASQDSGDSDYNSSDSELDESDENTDDNTDSNEDHDSSSSEVEEPPKDSRRKKGQNHKPKGEARVPRKTPKQQRGKPRHRGTAAYVEDETEESQDEWKRKKPSRYACVPPPAPNPPNN